MTGKKTQTGGGNSRSKHESWSNIWKARLSKCFWQSLATTSLRQSSPIQTYILRCENGQVHSPRKPSEWLEFIWIKQVVRITELIRFTGVIGLKRVLRFIWNFSIIRAGLREAARVLAQVLWASGLQCKFACFRTILQSKWPAYNPTSRKKR